MTYDNCVIYIDIYDNSATINLTSLIELSIPIILSARSTPFSGARTFVLPTKYEIGYHWPLTVCDRYVRSTVTLENSSRPM